MKKLFFLMPIVISGQLIAQKFLPPPGKQLLIVGQDLDAVKNYVNTGKYPTPAGHTVYISFFSINNPQGKYPYGGLGEDLNGNPVAAVDWGAGLVSAHTAAFDPLYKNTVLVIGLSMNGSKENFDAVGQGRSDVQIIRLGAFIKKVAKPVYLRIAYEFEGTWNPAYANAETYKAAFRRITEGLRRDSVQNFASVWQTSASPIDDIVEKKHENIEDWYPGDDVVDWMALSWFLNPQYQSSVSTIKTTQWQLAEELLTLARKHNKPVMIAESTPQGYDLKNLTKRNIAGILDGPTGLGKQKVTPQQIWKAWYEPYFNFIKNNKNLIRAVAYINTNWDSQKMWGAPYSGGYWGNSQVQENYYISKQWKKEISKSNWLHGSGKLFDLLKNY